MNDLATTKIQLNELFDSLRCALVMLVPIMERVGIPWTEENSYDDWEAITSTLYEQIVGSKKGSGVFRAV